MRSLLAILALAGAWLACLVLVRAARRRPTALAAPIALALLVVLEAGLLRGLSAFDAVSAAPILAAHVALVGLGASVAWRIRVAVPRLPRRRSWAFAGLALLFVLAAISALAYRPNNWDSMTYHLARVAHWIQGRSVAPYPTNIWRQNLLTPGAEYLLLVLQVVSGTDRLANLVQLGSWAILVGAVVPLARTFGASRGVARAGAVVVGAAPMAVLQASSTQNDLVAAVMTAGAVVGCVPLLHRRRRWRGGDLLLLLAALCGGILVKTPGLLFAAPLLVAAAVCWARGLELRALRDAGPALILGLALALPLGNVATAGAPITRPYVYAGFSDPADRLQNAVRGVLRNLPLWERAGDWVAPPQTEGCHTPGSLCLAPGWRPHEDSAASPALALLGLAALFAAALRFRRLRPCARLGAAALLLGWLTFHALIRDNVWIARLQLPCAAVVPVALGALSPARRAARWAVGALSILALVHGVWAAQRNLRRPLALGDLRGAGTVADYYHGGPPGLQALHDRALGALERGDCRRLGLFIGGDSYDYPLTWRAMQRGIVVRHLLGPDDWPCAVFSEGVPPARPDGRAWIDTDVPGFYNLGARP